MDPDTVAKLTKIMLRFEKEVNKNGFVTYDQKITKTEKGHYVLFAVLIKDKDVH